MKSLCAAVLALSLASADAKKNVLFFAVDDLRPELNCMGDNPIPGSVTPKLHTPNFDRLAARSLLMRKNYVQQAVCSPTRTSLLTGRRPDRTRTYDLYSYFRDVAANYTTIPEYFKDQHDFLTVGMGKIFHPGHASGMDDICCSWTDNKYWHAPNLGPWSSKNKSSLNGGNSWKAVTKEESDANPLPDFQTATHAVETIKNMTNMLKPEQNFFLAVGFHKPHLPFVFPEEMLEHYPMDSISLPPNDQPPKDMPPIAWSSYGELRAYLDQKALNHSGAPGTDLPDDDVRNLRRAYYSAVSATDLYLGMVLDALDASPFANNTVISLFGDHGWQLGEHGEWCKHTNFEFATRAPMMVSIPGITEGGKITDRYTEHADMFPTLVEAAVGEQLQVCPSGNASFGVPTCTEGTSVVPLAVNPNANFKEAAYSQYPRGYVKTMAELLSQDLGSSTTSPCIMENKNCTMGYSVISIVNETEYRYTKWCDFNTPEHKFRVNWNRCVGTELYDHVADPGENFNIYEQKPSVVAHLQQLLVTYAAGSR
eukprot:TRINITY_DN18357_c0_g1_i1.p1 TRINITY_DN18357_c0_g1~~TRINITY_DN18357_c0_g1_i1.p1  ORF type:complete len:538 (+),score=109.66 TRINITY_DN18357_c0_g1_i1:54-1667(+)